MHQLKEHPVPTCVGPAYPNYRGTRIDKNARKL
jgi:hypothetical protein